MYMWRLEPLGINSPFSRLEAELQLHRAAEPGPCGRRLRDSGPPSSVISSWHNRYRYVMCIYIYVCMSICVYIYMHMYICIYIYIYVCMFIYTHIYIYLFIYVCMHTHICILTCTYIHLEVSGTKSLLFEAFSTQTRLNMSFLGSWISMALRMDIGSGFPQGFAPLDGPVKDP